MLLRNLNQKKELTQEQLILAAINSEHPSVKKSIEKLAFVTEMSHTKKELQEMIDPYVRRVQTVFENDGNQKRYTFRWCGDNFEIVNSHGNIVQAGDGTPYHDDELRNEPVLVYVLDKD